MKIKGLTRQDEGGGYYRVHLPLGELAKHGHETVCERAKSVADAAGFDIAVGQVIGGHNSWWRCLRRDARLVYEIDDDPFALDPVNPVYHTYMNPVSQDSVMHCIEVADLVTVSTPVLAERLNAVNPNVVVLQNRIDESVLKLQRPRRDKLVIGWAGGSSHMNDIPEFAYGMRKIMQHNDVDIHFVGVDFRFLVPKVPIRFTGWCSKTTDYYKQIDFDIGLAPLKTTRFAEAKSHIKALEYAALGIPVVATDCAPYRDFVIDGVTGFLVRQEHEWARRLRDLINDEAMRTEMGAKAHAHAAEWTIQKGWQEWETAYKSIL